MGSHPGSGQERVNFWSSLEGAWPGPGGYSIRALIIAWGWGWESFQVPPSGVSLAEGAVRNCLLLGSFLVNLSFLVLSLISIVAVTVNFHISLLFPVNCSYLSLWSLCFVPSILISILLQVEREGKAWKWPSGAWFGESQWENWIGEYHS